MIIMDLISTAQLLSNVGEFFGEIAVVVMLVYLAGQLHQNTRVLHSSTYETYASSGTATPDSLRCHQHCKTHPLAAT